MTIRKSRFFAAANEITNTDAGPTDQSRCAQLRYSAPTYAESCARHRLASCNIAYSTPNIAANKNTSMKETMISSPLFGFLYTPPK